MESWIYWLLMTDSKNLFLHWQKRLNGVFQLWTWLPFLLVRLYLQIYEFSLVCNYFSFLPTFYIPTSCSFLFVRDIQSTYLFI